MKIEVLSDMEAIVDGERVRVCPMARKDLTILKALAERGDKIWRNPDSCCSYCDGYGVAKVREPPKAEMIGFQMVTGPGRDGYVTVGTEFKHHFCREDIEKMLARFEAVDRKAEA